MAINIKPCDAKDIDEARKLVPEGHAEPDWTSCWLVTDNEEIVQLLGAQIRLVVEPVYAKPGHQEACLMGLGWIDGVMWKLGAQYGIGGYELFIGDDHKDFQNFARKRLPVSEGKEKIGLYYFRSFVTK